MLRPVLRLLRRLRWPLLVLAGVELMLYATACSTASKLILFPTTHPVDSDGAERILLQPGKDQIEVFSTRSPGCNGRPPRAVVLAFTGNAGRAEWTAGPTAQLWSRYPVQVWAPNHPGYGRSAPPASLDRLAPAALVSYDALAARYPGTPIFVDGTSLGSTMALYVASCRPVAGVVLRTPVPLQRLILREHGWWNLWLLAGPVAMGVPSDLNTLETAPRCKVPAVIVLIDRDDVIPCGFQRDVASAYGGPTRTVVLHADDHDAPLDAPALDEFEHALQWLWDAAGNEKA